MVPSRVNTCGKDVEEKLLAISLGGCQKLREEVHGYEDYYCSLDHP